MKAKYKGVKWGAMNIQALISLYQREELPEDVNLIFVPIHRMAYGDFEIIRDYSYTHGQSNDIPGVAKETLTLQEYIVNGETVFAAYGEQSKSLIIGKERQ